MREAPPAQLAALLARLGLATDRDLEGVEPAVRRLAGDLPRFESVWIDALRQARFLTQFQAAEIHAGRGEALDVARYVVCQPVHECGYSAVYRAEDREAGETIRLAVFAPGDDPGEVPRRLEKLIAAGKNIRGLSGLITAAGVDGSRAWAASPWVEGVSLAELVLHHGRFPPETVLEIARAMLGELAALEATGLVHGDIRLDNVLIASDGDVHIPHAGLRSAIRPQEGIAHHDLAPDACSTLAPERVTEGTAPTVASDLFACGCVWWHILCGRPPLGGGDTLARLRAAQAAAIEDLHQWAADVPDALVKAIHDCLQKDPRQRPRSMSELAQRLGRAGRPGRRTIARCLNTAARPRAPWLGSRRTRGKKTANPHRLTAAVLALMALIGVAWPVWVSHHRAKPPASIAGSAGRAKPQARCSVDSAGIAPARSAPQPMVDTAVVPAGFSDGVVANQPPPHPGPFPGGEGDRLPPPHPSPLPGGEGDQPTHPHPSPLPGGEGDQLTPPHPNPLPGEEGDPLRPRLILPTDRPVRSDSLQLKPGQRVGAQAGTRQGGRAA